MPRGGPCLKLVLRRVRSERTRRPAGPLLLAGSARASCPAATGPILPAETQCSPRLSFPSLVAFPTESDVPLTRGFPVAQLVKNLPAMQETWARSLALEDPLEKGNATHSSILAWRIPWTDSP